MKVSEAETLICPLISGGSPQANFMNCVTTKCMLWKTTAQGRVEISREIEPYDMTPMNIGSWKRRKEAEGYENIGRDDGFRDVYVKYKEKYEGYCCITEYPTILKG